MSGSDDQGGAGRREVAYRLFAAEFDDADLSYSESDEERAPNYVVTPTGARVNRLFAVGVLTEVEPAGEDIRRARVVDPTGAFVVYAGQYQPDAQAFFDRADPPAFVAVTGKARTFQPDDADVTYTSVRPENVNEVTAETRDRWSVDTARQTLARVATMAGALAREERGDDLRRALEDEGVDAGLAAGIPLAIDHYGTTPAYLDAVHDLATQVAEVVAGDRDEVESFTTDPGASGDADLDALAALDLPASAGVDAEPAAGATASGAEAAASTVDDTTASTDTSAESGTDPAGGTASGPASEPAAESSTAVGADESDAEVSDDIGEFERGEFDIDDDEREAIEEEYGTEFQTGTEVEDPGEADIETTDAGAAEADSPGDATAAEPPEAAVGTPETDEAEADGTPDADGEAEADRKAETGETTGSGDREADEESGDAADVDLDTAVMDAMEAHDDGDGASEADIVAAVTDRLGVDDAAVKDAIQDALMGGKCYEPEDGVYKPI
ncbi:hypothetical protein BRC92_07460 [Halobacteriales archaeon QS_4_69_31]|nr:MAG: hypothetical protein BRC92_07460 [Halobacteriales archaeon QS_4_69_31]